MQDAILTLLYALSAWGAALNFPAWAGLFWRRVADPYAPARRRDTILMVRGGLAILSFGITGLASTRLLGAILEGTLVTVPNVAGVYFIGCMAVAEPLFLCVDEIHAKIRGRRSVAWRIYWAGTIGAVILFTIACLTGVLP